MRFRRPAPSEVPRWSPEALQGLPRHPIVGILHDVRSLFNVGAIFRIADAARMEKLYLCGITGHPPRREIEKVALGATETVPWEYEWNTLKVMATLRERGYRLAALEIVRPSRLYTEVRPEEFPLALLVGHETWGLGRAVLEECDFALEIPQFGAKRSLNVAVAFGIVVFELLHIWLEAQGQWRLEG